MLSGKNLFGAYPDGSFENAERFITGFVTRQIRDVLPDDYSRGSVGGGGAGEAP
jgi:hypothetical protein